MGKLTISPSQMVRACSKSSSMMLTQRGQLSSESECRRSKLCLPPSGRPAVHELQVAAKHDAD